MRKRAIILRGNITPLAAYNTIASLIVPLAIGSAQRTTPKIIIESR